jgi:hypothetical protein
MIVLGKDIIRSQIDFLNGKENKYIFSYVNACVEYIIIYEHPCTTFPAMIMDTCPLYINETTSCMSVLYKRLK